MLACKRIICLLLLSSLCFGADEMWLDFLRKNAQQLAQHTGETVRETRASQMLARRLTHIAQGGQVDDCDTRGQTALMMAAALNQNEIATQLLLHGANPGVATPKGKTAEMLCTDPELLQRLKDCNTAEKPGMGLHEALQQESVSANQVLQILRAGADANAKDGNGKTPLMLVPAQQTELAGMLIAAGARQEDWCAPERKEAKVSLIDVLFTHKGSSAEELEQEDMANAEALGQLARDRVKWRFFRDKALRRQRISSCPLAYHWNRRQKQFTHYNCIWKKEYLRNPEGADGISGYHGYVQRGILTLHYADNIPPLRFIVQAGGRARKFRGESDSTCPFIPEGQTARLYTDMLGYTIKGFLISCLGRKAIPKFSETRSDIMLHLATIAVPGQTEESTRRHNGSHGCISVLTLRDWESISSELRKKGGAGVDGVEIRIRYGAE